MKKNEWKPEIVWLPTGSVKPFERNAKKHPDDQVAKIAQQIDAHGFTQPILIDPDRVVIAGHGRLLAAQSIHLDQVPCVVADHLSDEQIRAVRLADNRVAQSEWDDQLLSFEIKGLELQEFDLGLTGFDDEELKRLLAIPDVGKLGDEDAIPEVEKIDWVKRGDLWTMGKHRLLCGDSTSGEDVVRLMVGERAQLIATDPPYGINHVAVSQEKGQSKGYAKIENDDKQDEALKDFIYRAIRVAIDHALATNFAFYMWHAMKMQAYFSQAAAAAAGILFHRQIIWVKPQFVFGRGQYHWRHELCLMGWLQGNEPPFYGERNQSTVWEIGRENDKIHPTQKPVRISEIPIENHTRPGDAVYEPFSGSGGMFIAAEKMGRRCFGLELDPHYCGVILRRWAEYTGEDPVREDGAKLSDLMQSNQ